MREHVSNFDRFWNSTFGLPQQYLMRLLRVIQDDRVSLFSKRGLFDMSLVPILGIFDGDRYDVGTKEKFDRTLGALGAKDNLGTRLLTEIATDPLTYLTAGITAAARGAATVNKARRTGVMRAAGMDQEIASVGKMRGAIDEALKGTQISPDQRDLLKAAREGLEGADEGALLSQVGREAGKRELRLGLPILHGYGATLWRNPAYESWTKFLLDKAHMGEQATSALSATKSMVSKTPVLGKVLDGIRANTKAFGAGFRGADKPLRVFQAEDNIELVRGTLRPLTDAGREIYALIQKRGADRVKAAYAQKVAELGRKGAVDMEWSAFEAALGKPVVKEVGGAGNAWDTITGRALTEVGMPTPENFSRHLDEFIEQTDRSVEHYRKGALTDAPSVEGLKQEEFIAAGRLKMFEAGRKLGEGLRKVFKSDTIRGHYAEAQRNFHTEVAIFQQAVEERMKTLAPMRAAAAAEAGLTDTEYDTLVYKLTETNAISEELSERMTLLEIDPQNAEAARALQDYSSRFINSMTTLRKIASGGRANPFLSKMLAQIEPLYGEGLKDGDTLRAIMDGVNETVEKWAPETSALMDSWGSYQMLTGANRGRHLQFMPSVALEKERRRLQAALSEGNFPFGAKAAASVVEDVPELKALRDTYGLEAEEVVELASAARSVKKFREAARRTAKKLDVAGTRVERAVAEEGAAKGAAAGARAELKQFAQSENKALTGQMKALNILESTVGEWSEEIGHIKERLSATRKVGRRAGKLWDEAFSDPGALPPSVEELFREFGAAHSIDHQAVSKLLKAYHGAGRDAKKFTAYMAHHGDVPVKAEDIEALMEKLEARLGAPPDGTVDMAKFDLARRAIGAEGKATRQLGELLKVREAEVAEWSGGIKTLKEDIAALQKEIRAEAKAKVGKAKQSDRAVREAARRKEQLGKQAQRIQERIAEWKKRADEAGSKLGDDFGVPANTVEALAQRMDSVEDMASAKLYGRELRSVVAVLRRRKEGKTLYTEIPRKFTVKFPHAARRTVSHGIERPGPGVDELIEELDLDEGSAAIAQAMITGGLDNAPEMVNTGEAISNALGLVVMAKEMARAARQGTTIAPDLHSAATEVIQHNSELMEQVFYGASGKAGEEYLKALEQMRREIDAVSNATGLKMAGSPIAYSPRVKGFKESKILDQLLDDSEFYQVIDTAMPTLGPVFRRNRDNMTVADMNLLARAVNDAAGPKAVKWRQLLDRFAEANGYQRGFTEYSEEALLNLMNRFAQGQRILTTKNFAERIFFEGERAGDMFGAQVVGVVRAAGGDVKTGQRFFKPGRTKMKGREVEVGVDLSEETVPELQALRVQTANGNIVTITGESLAMARGAVLRVGNPNLDRMAQIALEHGESATSETVAAAFAQKAARGMLSAESMSSDIGRAVEAFKEGDYLVFGNRDAIANTLGSIQGQWKNSGVVWNNYDMAHNFIKRLQTVYRPAFLAANIASAYPQSLLAGASHGAAARGYWHATRFMLDNHEFAGHYDNFAAMSAKEDGIKGVMRNGTEFLRTLRRNPTLKRVPWADEVAFKVGEQELTFRQMAPHLRTLLLSTATREGLRGGSRISGSLDELADLAKPGALGKVAEGVDTIAESAETFARLQTWLALVDDGMTLDRATTNALAAHVNYADLTSTERVYFKRFFGFYTWTRKITPVIWSKFTSEPAVAAKLAAAIRSDVIEEDENGNLVINAGKWTVAAERMNPSLDTLRLIETVGEAFQNVGAVAGVGREAARQEDIAGQTRAPLTAGGLTGIFMAGFTDDRDGAAAATEEAINSFWVSRIALGLIGGDEERTVSEQVFEQLLPVKGKKARERVNATIVSRTNRIIAELNRKIEATQDLDLAMRLTDQVGRLKEYAASLQAQ